VVRSELTDLYHSHRTDTIKRKMKADILHTFSQSYEQLVDEKWQGKRYYAAWFEKPVNNARLALYNTYEGSHCAFQGLLDKAGGDLQVFHQLAERKSRLQKDEREVWLQQTCDM